MADNFGSDVSFVYEDEGYNYDLVVFQKGKPPLDTELNLVQQLQNSINRRQVADLPSGWLTNYAPYTDNSLENSFYTQNPNSPKPEYALVNGTVVHVTNTNISTDNLNLIDLGDPPSSGIRINGVFLEMWRALIDPDVSTNKPDPETVIDGIRDIYMFDKNKGWMCGENGLILNTENSGQTWGKQTIDTPKNLNGIHFMSSTIGWVVGNEGTIAKTSSGGLKWTFVTSPTNTNLNSIFSVTQLVSYIVGNTGVILKTSNGVTWLPLSSGTTANLNKVHFQDELVGWAVGDGGVILKTTDGGANWLLKSSGITEKLNSIYFYDLNYGFAVGDNGTILRTSDGGETWVNQSGNIFEGPNYTTTNEDLHDVIMVPAVDVKVTDEEVSSQLNGSNKDFTVAHTPITEGDGKGTITTDTTDVTVTVNGTEVTVDSINGTTGLIVLANVPGVHDTVKVTYYYRGNCAVFTGTAWIAGSGGTILKTDDIGAKWVPKNPQTSYDLYAVDFYDLDIGWTAGDFSIIRYTEDGGSTWTEQVSEAVSRRVQRIYFEGNVDTTTYLDDNSIHPDVNVETTKRVQIQYRIRVIDNADPNSNPEAGLSSSILGLGPNSEGLFGYENMGPINGDYGLWRAECPGTVDNYCYAVPMYFINRRNTTAYDPVNNANGAHQKNTQFIRPDLLTAEDVVDGDILDVRRKIVIPSLDELLNNTFDQLSRGTLKARFSRATLGGDRYGSELMQLDRIGGTESDGGEEIEGRSLIDAVNGDVSSENTLTTLIYDVSAPSSPPVPTQQVLGPITGIFHPDPTRHSVVYDAAGSTYDGKPVPGYFEGIGTNTVTFVFGPNAKTKQDDSSIQNYRISAVWINSSANGLKYIPSTPKLVKNISGSGSPSFWYQGVKSDENRIIESWDSGITGHDNYVTVYPVKEYTNEDQQHRSSPLELHYFKRLTSSDISGTNTLYIDPTIQPDVDDIPYTIKTISKINNLDSGFSYKIENITFPSNIEITSESGFEFIEGVTIEIIAFVESSTSDTNVRNGASVNFIPRIRKINSFCKSVIATGSISAGYTSTDISVTNTEIIGASTTETSLDLNQHICWIDVGGTGTYEMKEVTVTGFGTSTVTLTFSTPQSTADVMIQLLVKETSLTYQDAGNNDGLLIAYDYIPYQSSDLPSSLSMKIVTDPKFINVSNLGAGGGVEGNPYENPIEHIPVNNISVINENYFANKDSLIFGNFSIDSGYVRMPSYVPGSFGDNITLSSVETDALTRSFYSVCDKDFSFITESLQSAVPRKVYIAVLARVESESTLFLKGEYIMVIFSQDTAEVENSVGCDSNTNNVAAIYRLKNKPLSRI